MEMCSFPDAYNHVTTKVNNRAHLKAEDVIRSRAIEAAVGVAESRGFQASHVYTQREVESGVGIWPKWFLDKKMSYPVPMTYKDSSGVNRLYGYKKRKETMDRGEMRSENQRKQRKIDAEHWYKEELEKRRMRGVQRDRAIKEEVVNSTAQVRRYMNESATESMARMKNFKKQSAESMTALRKTMLATRQKYLDERKETVSKLNELKVDITRVNTDQKP